MSKRLSYEVIKASFESEGYTLLTEVYENVYQKLEYICPRGHRHSMTLTHWRRGVKCPCFSNSMKPTIEFIRKKFEKAGFTLLTKIYENNRQKLDYICPEGHRHSISWSSCGPLKKIKCAHCSRKAKKTIEFIRGEFAKEDYILLTEVYENAHQKLEYICPEGHRHSISWSNWKAGKRCPFRSNGCISEWEKVVKNFLGTLDIGYVPNDKSQLINPNTGCRLELDIWFPDLNKAIECNGLYWHSKPDRKKCDKIKKQLCKDQGIDLLVITDKEWNDDVDKCKNKIQEFLC